MGDEPYFDIESVGGGAHIEVRPPIMLYHLFLHWLDKEEMHPFIGAVLSMIYGDMNIVPDIEFLEDWAKRVNELVERYPKSESVATEEEDLSAAIGTELLKDHVLDALDDMEKEAELAKKELEDEKVRVRESD